MGNISSNLRFLRKERGLNQSQIADLVDKKHTTVGNWENEIGEPSATDVYKICQYFGIKVEDFISLELSSTHLMDENGILKIKGKNPPNYPPNHPPNDDFTANEPHEEYVKSIKKGALPLIPVEAAAGYMSGSVQVLNHEVTEWYSVPEFTRIGANFLISVKGQSMHPIYYSGDLLACKKITDTFIQWGKVYVLDTDQGPVVKRLYPGKSEDYVECRSENSEMYPPYQLPKDQIRSMCLVVGLIRFE